MILGKNKLMCGHKIIFAVISMQRLLVVNMDNFELFSVYFKSGILGIICCSYDR